MPTVSSRDGTRIGHETIGDGPPVVLVDGAMCYRDSGPMRPLADRLSERLTAHLYDRRGRGESGDTLPYAVAREIEDLDAVIGASGDSAALVGISSGGALALAAAAELGPERVTSVAVFEPPYLPDPALAGAAEYTAELTDALSRGDHDAAVASFLRRIGMPAEAIDGARRAPSWSAMMALAPTLAYDDACMGDSSVPADLAGRIGVPVLALAGGASPAFLRYGAESVAQVVPDGRFALLDGQGHDAGADALAPHLLPFLVEDR